MCSNIGAPRSANGHGPAKPGDPIRRETTAIDFPPPIIRTLADGLPEERPVVSTNPKKAQGMSKPPMHLIPDSALVEMAMAFRDGGNKYGPYNWRDDPVDITTYVAAAKRHLALYFNGQERTSDTGVHNLGAVMACCAILIDAENFGLVDDRPKPLGLERIMVNAMAKYHGKVEA